MTRYKTSSGLVCEASSAAELVSIIHAATWAPVASDEEFMEDAARRAFETTGKPVRFGTPEDFVEDMLAYGLIEEVKPNDKENVS